MEIVNQKISKYSPFSENGEWTIRDELTIENCIIEKVNIPGLTCESLVTIRNSIIYSAHFSGTFFVGGLVISQCLFINEFLLDCGGHNSKGREVQIEGNIFCCFADFLDSHFDGKVVIRNNIFQAGSCYLNMGKPGSCIYNDGIVSENNIGKIDLD